MGLRHLRRNIRGSVFSVMEERIELQKGGAFVAGFFGDIF